MTHASTPLRHLFVDHIILSLGVTVFVSERAPDLMMQLLAAPLAPAADATLTALIVRAAVIPESLLLVPNFNETYIFISCLSICV